MSKFKLCSKFKPRGDQPKAIKKLVYNIIAKEPYSTLLGTTGSGKTFTLASVISKINLPVLVISHNKTLAAQLYSEFKEFFPDNAVEYFVSYYDYYQPEAYIPSTDTYIEKDASINERLDRLRLSATASLLSRKDLIIVSSVSCIYNLGDPQTYQDMLISLKLNQKIKRDNLIEKLILMQYERNDYEFIRGYLRVRGDTLEIFPPYLEKAIRIELTGERISRILDFNPVSSKINKSLKQVSIYPAKHFMVSRDTINKACRSINDELSMHLKKLKLENKLL
jgi:excinuclease ABC subunit B